MVSRFILAAKALSLQTGENEIKIDKNINQQAQQSIQKLLDFTETEYGRTQ
jgi:quinolinate synthase